MNRTKVNQGFTQTVKLILSQKYETNNLNECHDSLEKRDLTWKFTDQYVYFNRIGLLKLYTNNKLMAVSRNTEFKNMKKVCEEMFKILKEPLIPSENEYVKSEK